MRVVAANTAPFLVGFERRSGGARVFVAEVYVIVYVIADSLHAEPAKWGAPNRRQALSDRRSVSQ